ncbi:MAG: hypothetical protein R3E83_20955 [Burkholderiaceae bacterium]
MGAALSSGVLIATLLFERPIRGPTDPGVSPVSHPGSHLARIEPVRGKMIWIRELLERFLTEPEGMFPGVWMSTLGMRDADKGCVLVRYTTSQGLPSAVVIDAHQAPKTGPERLNVERIGNGHLGCDACRDRSMCASLARRQRKKA